MSWPEADELEAAKVSGLEEVASLVRRESGIVIKPAAYPILGAAMARAAPGWDARRLVSAVSDPAAGADIRERLIDEVTVKETFFFRHRRELETIDWMALWEGARARGRQALRVWSAACATGEEPYTLAILACEAFASPTPPVSILGTDISRSALAVAQRGAYGERAVRELTEARTARWLRGSGTRLSVAPELRRLVRLRHHNLTRDSIPPLGEPPFDLIVCRNVLIYFDRPTVRRLLVGLERALSSTGSLVIGAADRLSGPLDQSRPRRAPTTPRGGAGPNPPAVRPRPPQATAPRNGDGVRADRVAEAARSTRAASLDQIAAQTGAVLERDPLNADAYFVRGVAQLASGDPAGAVASLRRALYLQPNFALAAFKLARAHEALHDLPSARRAYTRALDSLRPDDPAQSALLEQVMVGDLVTVCRKRLAELDGSR